MVVFIKVILVILTKAVITTIPEFFFSTLKHTKWKLNVTPKNTRGVDAGNFSCMIKPTRICRMHIK